MTYDPPEGGRTMSIADEARTELVGEIENALGSGDWQTHSEAIIVADVLIAAGYRKPEAAPSDNLTDEDAATINANTLRALSARREAAPSDTDLEMVANALHADDCADDGCDGSDMAHYDRQAYLALETLSRTSQPVPSDTDREALVSAVYEGLGGLVGSHVPTRYAERVVDALQPLLSRTSQPVQVEVTEERVIAAVALAIQRADGYMTDDEARSCALAAIAALGGGDQ